MSQPLVIIQARLGSTRLPEKINAMIGGRRMLDQVIRRVEKTGLPYQVALAEAYPAIPDWDVLTRFRLVIGEEDWDPIIRITADCPLLDPGIVQHLLWAYSNPQCFDLVGTGPEWDGLDVEVMSTKALARAYGSAVERYDREHVTSWIKEHGTVRRFHLKTTLRWSVDTLEGLEFVRSVYKACEHCAEGVPWHTNAGGSIGGSDRQPVFDLHHLERGDLAECRAYDILKQRMGGPVYVSQ